MEYTSLVFVNVSYLFVWYGIMDVHSCTLIIPYGCKSKRSRAKSVFLQTRKSCKNFVQNDTWAFEAYRWQYALKKKKNIYIYIHTHTYSSSIRFPWFCLNYPPGYKLNTLNAPRVGTVRYNHILLQIPYGSICQSYRPSKILLHLKAYAIFFN
jgi:hypothetical protein